MRTRLTLLIGFTAALLAAPSVAGAATITVNTTDDVNAGVCTLRDAITAANTNTATGGCVKGVGADTINFNLPASSVITVGSTLPTIQSPVDIQGPGSSQLTLDGGNSVRVLNVGGSGSGTIAGLTVTHGQCIEGCGIYNSGNETLDHVTVTGNQATSSGGSSAFADAGGIRNQGTLHLTFTTVTNNTATASGASSQNAPDGGGIENANATMTIDHSTLSGNSVAADAAGGSSTNAAGGAISNFGTLNVAQSTISSNSVTATGGVNDNNANGGGVSSANSPSVHVTLDRVTIAGNSVSASGNGPSAGAGGMRVQGASTAVTSSTIAGNSAPSGANLAGNPATVKNTIVADPQGGGTSCTFQLTSQGYNIDSGSSCGFNQPTDQHSTNPMLDSGGLADNGGPTKTIALQPGSPAIDQGLSSVGETVDQRGSSRPNDNGAIPNANGGDGTDVGAYEAQDTTPPDTSIDSGPADGSANNGPDPAFAFSASEQGSTFECSVDGGGYSPCTSPDSIGPLGDGQHTFAVRATDPAHNVDPTPATRTFSVDATAPNTSITSGPADGALTNDANPHFGVASDDASATFECSLDGAGFAACSSSDAIGPLADGQHTFAVRAVDAAHNADPSPATRTFTVDTKAPETSLVKPVAKTTRRTLKLRFASSEPGSKFMCSLDGKAYKSCASPMRTPKLKYGRHTLKVRAVDAAGNADPSPAKQRFRVVRPA